MVEACCGCAWQLPVMIDTLLFIFFPFRFGFILFLFILTGYCYGLTTFDVGGLEGHS
jgi:hypothetical protein